MRLVFMGTPDFAAVSLRALIEANHDVCAVFTQPDKPVGRRQAMTSPPVKELAMEHGLPVYQPNTLKDGEAAKIIAALSPDVIVVVAYGKLIPKEILTLAPYGCINVHGSVLPQYRGAAPIQWSVIRGERFGGVSTMRLDEGMDTGPVLLCEKTEILPNETAGELYARLSPIGAQLLLRTLDGLVDGTVSEHPQEQDLASYAPMLSKEMARLDFTKDAESLCHLIAGLNPWPVAFAFFEGKRLKVYRARLCEGDGEPGQLLSDKRLTVACTTGALELLEVALEGSRTCSGEEFARGHRGLLGLKLS